MQLPELRGRIEQDYPLKNLNSWKIGGPGEFVFWPESNGELQNMFGWCRQQGIPFLLLGRGSNVLLPDQGIKGIVTISTELKNISWQEDSVLVGAGYPLMRLAREAAERGLWGLEFACGIPGTLGAAIAINAGACGSEIGAQVTDVTVLTAEAEIQTLNREEIRFGYRESSLVEKNLFVLESNLKLQLGDRQILQGRIDTYMTKRKETQPLEYPNAGSVFRNPPGDSAGRLIELAGWKGKRKGDAQVSEKHANFIVNRGNAKAADVLFLIREIQSDISTKFGVELKTEIKVIT